MATLQAGESKRRLLFVVTEDWYFVSHRLPMARAAQAAGFEVHVATRIDRHAAAIEAEGFRLHALDWRRRSLSPWTAGRDVAALRLLYRQLAPDVVHHVAVKPVLFGSMAAAGMAGPAIVNSIAGLGHAFTARDRRTRLLGAGMGRALGLLLRRRRSATVVQNDDDRRALEAIGVPPARILVVRGSGVDVEHLTPAPEPEPDGPVTVTFVGRMLTTKGVDTLVAAHGLLAERGIGLRLRLAGTPDPENPASIAPGTLAEWAARPGVEYLGHVPDIGALWADSHIAALPSHREGLPKSLLEAAACGRPIVATDVPGCREIAVPDVNGLLVPVNDPERLADALARLAGDAELRRRFGEAGRRLAETEFAASRIGAETVGVYERLLAEGRSGA